MEGIVADVCTGVGLRPLDDLLESRVSGFVR